MSTADSTTLADTLADIADLLTWPEGWNSYDALPPDPSAVAGATAWIVEVYQHIATQNQQWIEPHITACADGAVSISWCHEQRTLDIIIHGQCIDYLQAWERGADAKLTDGHVKCIDDMQQLWQWLLEKEASMNTTDANKRIQKLRTELEMRMALNDFVSQKYSWHIPPQVEDADIVLHDVIEELLDARKKLAALEEGDTSTNKPLPEKFEQAANNIAGLLDIAPSAQEIIRVHLCLFAIYIAEQMFPELTPEEARIRALSIKDMPRASWNKEYSA